ncbi:MAG: amidohydrolase family protein [Microthrixaceae bacterium]
MSAYPEAADGSLAGQQPRVVRADWVLPMTAGRSEQDPHADVLVDGAVAISGGLVVDVGPAGEVIGRMPGAPVEELAGHALLPGFVNAHTHLAMTMFRGVADDRTLEDFLGTVLPLEGRALNARRVGIASRGAMVESHLAGVTTALDMYFFCDATLEAAEALGFRVLTGPVFLDDPVTEMPGATRGEVLDRARSWLAGHPVSPGWVPSLAPHSTYLVSPDLLGEVAELSGAAGAVVQCTHRRPPPRSPRSRAGTGSAPSSCWRSRVSWDPAAWWPTACTSTAPRWTCSRSGASVAHCPASNLKLGSGVAPVADLLAAGVNVALGTDGPASSNDLDVLGAARLAALVHKTAAPGGPDPRAVPARTAIEMATCNGARALGLEGQLGVPAPGASADLVAIDLDRPHTQPVNDVFSALVYAAGRGDVTHVWSGGTAVVVEGRHTRADESEVSASLVALAAEIDGDR